MADFSLTINDPELERLAKFLDRCSGNGELCRKCAVRKACIKWWDTGVSSYANKSNISKMSYDRANQLIQEFNEKIMPRR
jgi:hypothetical protein